MQFILQTHAQQEDYSFTPVLNEIEEEFSEANQQHYTHMLLSAFHSFPVLGTGLRVVIV